MSRKGKKAYGEGAQETPELWFISLADLFSLLFSFFVLLTSVSAAPKNCNGLALYFEQHRQQYTNFELRGTKSECIITLPSDYLFQSGEDQLQAASLTRLRQLFEEVRTLKEHETDFIVVEGHTDEVPIHTKKFPSNWELSSARATNVANFMRQVGLKADKVSVRAFADNRPRIPYIDDFGKALAGNTLQEARRRNRRVEIVLANAPSRLETYALLFH
jgi:flagellar motor protein MotB